MVLVTLYYHACLGKKSQIDTVLLSLCQLDPNKRDLEKGKLLCGAISSVRLACEQVCGP